MTYEFVMLGIAAAFYIFGIKYHEHLYRKAFQSLCDQGILSFYSKPSHEWSELEKKLDPEFTNFTTTSGYMPHIKRMKSYLDFEAIPESDRQLFRRSVLAYYSGLTWVLGFIIFLVNVLHAESF